MMETAVSEFIDLTCTVHSPPNINRYYGIASILVSTEDDFDGNDVTHLVVNTPSGSSSELYINPMLPLIGDIDVMWYVNNQLVVPHGYHVTDYVQLPVEFHTSEKIKLCEFIETEFPGYVFMRLIGELIKNGKSGKYKFVRATEVYDYVTLKITDESTMHGPANVLKDGVAKWNDERQRHEMLLSVDFVECTRCLQWPPQAAEWSTRHRKYEYPDTATIQRVVDNGCHLVCTAHRQCKHIKWYRERMHRISFSRAETTLLNGWSPKQQTVYHVLRYIMKKVSFIESEQSRCGIFSNYYLKTLMLWSCELHSQQWWTLSLVRITTELLHELGNLLASGECKQYFIIRCNLFDYFNDFDSSLLEFIYTRLSSVTVDEISVFLIENYVRECEQLCPAYVQQLMNDVSTVTDLQNVTSLIVDWRFESSYEKSCSDFATILDAAEKRIRETNVCHLPTYGRFIESLQEVDGRLVDHFIALIFLHFTELIEQGQNISEIVEVINALMKFEESRVSVRTESRSSSMDTSYTMATNILMKLKMEVNTDTMLQVELAKALFHASIESTDVDQPDEDCLSHYYLAYLYYSTEQYQFSFDQFRLVTKLDQARCSSHIVYRKLSPDNDDETRIVSGLIVLYQFITQNSPSCQQATRPCLLAANLCPLFYMVKCGRRLVKDTRRILQRYVENIIQSESLFIGDVLLIYFIMLSEELYSRRSSCIERVSRSQPTTVFNSFRLRSLLIKSAVERLTAVRNVMSRDYSSVRTIARCDYEAMYAYKCGEYERCLHLCQQNIHSLLGVTMVTRSFALPFSDLLLLMDDDCLSVIGLCSLAGVHHVSVERNNERVTQMSLLLYLLVQCKLKLKHSNKSFVDVLRNILLWYRRTRGTWITERLSLIFAYQRARRMLH